MPLPNDTRIPRSQISEEQALSNCSIPSAWWERQGIHVWPCLQVLLGTRWGLWCRWPHSEAAGLGLGKEAVGAQGGQSADWSNKQGSEGLEEQGAGLRAWAQGSH